MISGSLERMEYLCRIIPDKLRSIPAAEFEARSSPGKWSKKEILGHLIDSATNNHHRFVRAQFEDRPLIDYHAETWVRASHYQSIPTNHLIHFWLQYNLHLAELIRQIPADILQRECDSGDPVPHTLAWLFDDYVVHLEHHLHQLVDYS